MKIIVSGPHKVLAPCLIQNEAEISGCAKIARLTDVADSSVSCGVFTAYLFGLITRGIVGNDQFEVSECLRQ